MEMFSKIDEDTYNQTIGGNYQEFKRNLDISENIEEIQTDMELLLEGVHAPKVDPYLEMGLMILEINAPLFHYSKEYYKLSYSERMNELKKYYYSIGYDNQGMLNLINKFRNRKTK